MPAAYQLSHDGPPKGIWVSHLHSLIPWEGRCCLPQDCMRALGVQAEQVLHTGVSGAGVKGRGSAEERLLPGDRPSYPGHRHTLLWHAPSG